LHESSTLYIQRGKDGYGKREVLQLTQSDMFVDELESFTESIATGRPSELSAYNGVVAVAVVNAALRSIEDNGRLVKLSDVIDAAETKAGAKVT
jgi:hypothetical protein